MVLSSQTTRERTRHSFSTDVAACWGNLAGAAATGAEGCNSLLLPNPSVMLGDTETGDVVTHLTLPFWKYGVGCWERCNISPTGGRQHVGDGMRLNGVTLGDDQRAKGQFVLQGATWADRRIAQASKGRKHCGYGVFRLRSVGASGQDWMDTFRPSRDVDSVGEGKPRVRNICGAKGLRTDCTANRPHLLVGLHLRESGQKSWLTWEAAGYTSDTRFLSGRPGVGAVVTRFKPNELGLPFKCGVLTAKSGRKLPSVKGQGLRLAGNICEDLRHALPSTRTRRVGPRNVSMLRRVTPARDVVKHAPIVEPRASDSRTYQQSSTLTTGRLREPSAGTLYTGSLVGVSTCMCSRHMASGRTTSDAGCTPPQLRSLLRQKPTCWSHTQPLDSVLMRPHWAALNNVRRAFLSPGVVLQDVGRYLVPGHIDSPPARGGPSTSWKRSRAASKL